MAFSSNAQQPGYCGTVASSDAPTTIDLRSAGEVQGPLYIRLYISIVRDDNGDGGQPPERAQQAFDILQKDFAPYGIFFVWDCNINYVDDSYHYEGVYGPSYNDILYDADYLHDDGVDLFLFEDVANNGIGKAKDIVSKACYVFGNSHLSPGPNTPLGETSVVSHEVGHCLGLFHTFRTDNGAELVNGVNCQSAGDFVCDTPADVDDGFTVGYPSCEWNGNDVDDEGDLYDPDETNIMSYSHPLCYKGFSDGQAERMRFLIATEPTLQDCIVEPDASLYTITSNTTWSTTNTPNNGDFFVGGNVTITDGATLTIESDVTVRFGEESRVVIEPGSRLNLHGKLTGLGCNGNTWKGILVSGDTNLPQTQANQGYLRCYAGAMIENAEIGVHVVDNLSVAAGGGMVRCQDMTIKNCETGVKLTRYEYGGNNVASFTRTAFLNDNSYPHSEAFYAFADLAYVGGVIFRGCSFINEQSDGDYDDQNLNIENWGYGIRANSSGFNVKLACDDIFCNSFEESLFMGLGYGVYAFTGTPGGGDNEQPYPYEVSKATFENCLVGIRNASVEGSKIIYNTFVLGGPTEGMPEFAEVDQIGVLYENDVVGFVCEENEFIGTGSAANIFTIGTIVKSTGIGNKTIRKSTYQDLAIGNLANGQNAGIPGTPGTSSDRGMYYDCNQHDAVTFSDYMVEDGGSIRLDQSQKKETPSGDFDNLATGNLFSQTGDPVYDFLNEGVFSLRYFYDQSEIRAFPFTQSGVFTQPPDDPSFSCPTEFCEPPQICTEGPTKEEHKEGFFDSEGAFEDLLASYASQPDSNTLKGLQYHQQEMDKHAYAVIRSQLQDTLQFNIDSLRTWVRHLNSLEGDLWLVRSYVGDHDLTAAGQLLNQIPTKYNLPSHLQQDMQDYALLANMLYNKSLDSLGEPTLQQLEAYTDSGYYSEAWAKNILAGHGWHFPPDYTRDYTPPQALIDIGNTGTPSADKAVSLLRVQPNPASDQVRFDYQVPENTEQLQLRVIDITGRAVWQQAAHSTVGSLQWQIGTAPRGLYLYQLWANGELLESGKLIVK